MPKAAIREDHRPRVAAEKRLRMRRKLIENALLVFAEKGVDASVIEDVIGAAGVSRGTFYNYYRTNAELQLAASDELGNEIVQQIENQTRDNRSPAARICTGVRLYLGAARQFPLFARFVARLGLTAVGPDNLVYRYLPAHLEEGMAAGEFARMPVAVALDVVLGSVLTAVKRIAANEADDDHLQAAVLAMLRGLGVAEPKAQAAADAPLAPLLLGDDTLFMRSHARFLSQRRRRRERNRPANHAAYAASGRAPK
jgi:AcrR family transcriptional regulator